MLIQTGLCEPIKIKRKTACFYEHFSFVHILANSGSKALNRFRRSSVRQSRVLSYASLKKLFLIRNKNSLVMSRLKDTKLCELRIRHLRLHSLVTRSVGSLFLVSLLLFDILQA